MSKKIVSLSVCLMLAGLVSFPSMAGITLRASQAPQPQSIQVTTYLTDENKPLEKALLIHNLMNEMPGLRDMAQTSTNLKKQGELFKEMQKNISSCNVKKLGKVFKNPEKVWSKMMATYEQKRQDSQKEIERQNQDKLTMSLKQRQQNEMTGWKINRDIMIDVYANPEKWGEVNSGESFPLWQDQISLFEKEWNQFYENLNAAYGVPLKGRPAVDEETRHNAAKYNTVLSAHKAYVAEISQGRRPANPTAVNGNPPKAPKPLPNWKDIVRIDPLTGKATPELPEPWKEMSNDKFKNYADGGEMSKAFVGKSMTPTIEARLAQKTDLENEYEMALVVDAIDKGDLGTASTQQKMIQPFIKKLNELGIDTTDFNISNRGHYARVQKQLKELKKKAIEEAYKYIEELEKQDRENPDYVARRERLKSQKRARLSAEAQAAAAGISEALQISQMSPTVQQHLALMALEKDEGASVYLTQTNVLNVDQLMREQKSTDKIIAESYQQINSVMDKQRENIPLMTHCQF